MKKRTPTAFEQATVNVMRSLFTDPVIGHQVASRMATSRAFMAMAPTLSQLELPPGWPETEGVFSANAEVDAYAKAKLAQINEQRDKLVEREMAFERFKAAMRLDCEGTAKQLHHLADIVAGLMNHHYREAP